MNVDEQRRDDRFIVRIWRESERSPHWRASVSHLGSREMRYFTNYGDLCDFLNRWAEPAPANTIAGNNERNENGI